MLTRLIPGGSPSCQDHTESEETDVISRSCATRGRKIRRLNLKTSTEGLDMDRYGFATYKTPEAIASRREFYLARQLSIQISKSTRRMLRLAAKQQRTLARINKLEARRKAKLANFDIRSEVKRQVAAVRQARRTPHLRVRSRDHLGYEVMPKMEWWFRGVKYLYPTNGWSAYRGITSSMVDYTPTMKLNPPRNEMWAYRLSRNSALASAFVRVSSQEKVSIPKSRFGIFGLNKYPLSLTTSNQLTMDPAVVNRALQRVQAKIYSADIQMNEYLFEWKQVLRLMLDPYRTVLRMHSLLERWTRRDSWIWIPNRTLRRCGKGTLASKTPSGGMLLSMRTRKEISPVGVSKKVLEEACNRWLQYRYGIMPLALDITTVMGDWAHPKLSFPRKSESARIWVSKTRVTSDYSRTEYPVMFEYRVTKETGTFYSVKQWYDLLEEPPMSYKLGVHPSQWVTALWNGLPWSFVADWVVNINDYLTATTDVSWIRLGANVLTMKQYERVHSKVVRARYYISPYPPLKIDGDAYATARAEKVYREVDLPRSVEPALSSAWQTVKNAITALTLVGSRFLGATKHTYAPIPGVRKLNLEKV